MSNCRRKRNTGECAAALQDETIHFEMLISPLSDLKHWTSSCHLWLLGPQIYPSNCCRTTADGMSAEYFKPSYLSFMLGLAASALELSILRSPMSFSIEERSLSNSLGSGTATVAAAGLS
jgi:hypothetical protein